MPKCVSWPGVPLRASPAPATDSAPPPSAPLEVRLDQPDVPRMPQIAPAVALGEGALHTGPPRILRLELRSLLPRPRRLQRDVLCLGPEHQLARPGRRLGAVSPAGTAETICASKHHLDADRFASRRGRRILWCP